MPTFPFFRLAQRRVDPQLQSPLFGKLPAELRLIIFRLALQSDRPVCLVMKGSPSRLRIWTARDYAIHPSGILRTCRGAYDETRPILYGENTFRVVEMEPLQALMRSTWAHIVKRLDVHWKIFYGPPGIRTDDRRQKPVSMRTWNRIWVALAAMPSLQSLHVRLLTRVEHAELWAANEARLLLALRDVVRRDACGELVLEWPRSASTAQAAEDFLTRWTVKRDLRPFRQQRGLERTAVLPHLR